MLRDGEWVSWDRRQGSHSQSEVVVRSRSTRPPGSCASGATAATSFTRGCRPTPVGSHLPFAAWKNGPPRRVLTVTAAARVIRTTRRNRFDNGIAPIAGDECQAAAAGDRCGPFLLAARDHAAQRSAGSDWRGPTAAREGDADERHHEGNDAPSGSSWMRPVHPLYSRTLSER